jgi:stress-induced morphogen
MSKMETTIKNLLIDSLKPSILSITNESYMHSVPEDSESHFKIVIVSNNFKNQSNVKRHQLIYRVLDDIMKLIHALSIYAFDEDEYKENPIVLDSPNCINN